MSVELGENIDSTIMKAERHEALQGQKSGSAGPDLVHNQMLKNLSPFHEQKL